MADSGICADEKVPSEIVKEGPVNCGGKQMTLLLTTSSLTLIDNNSGGAKPIKGLDLLWCDVITAQPSKKFKGSDEKRGFCLHYMELKSNKKLQSKRMDILSSFETADVWIDTIQKQCSLVENRPKKLFIVINPIGGSQSGQQAYEKKVRPIFEMAQIHVVVQVTERANHALEIAENQDFSSFDGIVVLGGDGTYHEVLQGLTVQVQKASGVDYHDRGAKLKALSKPIGVIPTGTGNGVSDFFNGTKDVETAALRVVRGEQHSATILSIHSGGKLFAICGLLVAYGFFSDMIKRTEELRWMKRARYPYCLLASMFGKARGWQCDLEYRLSPITPSSGENKCASGDQAQSTEALSNEIKWIKHDGKGKLFKGVSTFIANVEKKGDKLYVDAFADRVSLLVDQGCSSIGLLKFTYKHMTSGDTEPKPSNLEIIKNVQGFRLKLIRDSAEPGEPSEANARTRELEEHINIDGESKRLEVSEFEMSVIQSFAPVYGINQAEM